MTAGRSASTTSLLPTIRIEDLPRARQRHTSLTRRRAPWMPLRGDARRDRLAQIDRPQHRRAADQLHGKDRLGRLPRRRRRDRAAARDRRRAVRGGARASRSRPRSSPRWAGRSSTSGRPRSSSPDRGSRIERGTRSRPSRARCRGGSPSPTLAGTRSRASTATSTPLARSRRPAPWTESRWW